MQSVRAMSDHQTVQLGALLRKARCGTGINQLELSLRLGVSQRHVSFVERGYSRPGRMLLSAWLTELEAPLPARNAITLHAGYAPTPALDPSAGQVLDPGCSALLRAVEAHNPLPAFLFDAEWRVSFMNEGGQRMCALLMADYWSTVPYRQTGLDMIDAITNPRGLLSCMDNAPEVAILLLRRLRSEEWARPTLQERIDAFEESVHRRFGNDIDMYSEPLAQSTCALQLHFTTAHGALSFHAVQNVVGLPQNVNLQSSRIELWFPADERTRLTIMRSRTALGSVA